MNRWKICSLPMALALVALCVPSAHAQAPSIPIVGVGSSAIFPSAAIAATVGDPVRGITTPLCGARFWTGSASAIDARATLTTPNIPNEGGTLWVAWDNDTTPTIICAVLSVDSIVGQRLFFGQGSGTAGNATLTIATSACTTPGANKIAFVWDTATSGLPIAVWNALMGGTNTSVCTAPATPAGVHFNVAFTDVRPEDAQFVGNQRVLCTDSNSSAAFPPDDKSCLGFNTGSGVNPGTAVTSSVSTSSAQAIFYAFSGTDPISGTAIPAAQTFSIGGEAVIPVINTIDTSTAGLGTLSSSGALTSVSSHALSGVYSGNAVLTRDLFPGGSGLASNVLHALQREAMSGTFTTFEWQVIRQRDGANFSSQESGICGPTQGVTCGYVANCFSQAASTIPTTPCSNPVNTCIGTSCGLRMRVIGTGQMVSTLNNATWTVGGTPGQTPSFIGYAFWSLGSFGGKANIKYLALDGVDGLFPGYSTTGGGHNGAFPGVVCTTPPPGPVNCQGFTPTVSGGGAGTCQGYFNGNGSTISNFSCNAYALPTFDGVTSGNYRAWNILRGSYYGAAQTPNFSPLNIAGFVLGAQDQAAPVNPNRIPDFFPTAYSNCSGGTCTGVVTPLNVFRSHYAVSSWGIGSPNNGVASGTENGGDVAGAIFNTQIEKDFASIFSNSFTTWVQ